jgi:hypothetical protein
MNRAYWIKALRQAEAELEAATQRSDVAAAAKKFMRAKAELKRLEAERVDGAEAGLTVGL